MPPLFIHLIQLSLVSFQLKVLKRLSVTLMLQVRRLVWGLGVPVMRLLQMFDLAPLHAVKPVVIVALENQELSKLMQSFHLQASCVDQKCSFHRSKIRSMSLVVFPYQYSGFTIQLLQQLYRQ